ncbi:MAG TPA: CoB--CoM heterodisulfide reductase iron-sulfur subunit B family protein [Deltaproteobacteria bacterium]|nr:CoB--CoM heterodisulfide reductase iron-sulfur subunit B family protein [Deltaproteobacteria bacterium]HPR56180.1 CoB--CoM heterodisulfide reductase iron-sulfur subunit B family protein [Deltaproteobacteria bacterium]HXK46445.1 CoB--CoM heterodisulfide reductase iron-sulfur subunit B family protein [Deltaproteobacteria bacterium]
MRYAYFPGCSAESTARDMNKSTYAIARALKLDLEEPRGWTCCGATAGHQTDRLLAVALPAANLSKVKDMNMDMVVNCAACYNRMKVANHEITTNADIRRDVRDALDRDYDGTVKVRHFLEVLLEDVGLPAISKSLKRTMKGIKVACYYGCLLVRPPEILKFDDAENPKSLDRLITAMGGLSLEWPCKVDCCGGSLSLSRTDVVLRLTESILDMAVRAGADCIAVSCPMCQINLDVRQQDINREMGRNYRMPVIYITQLLGLCLGLRPAELGFEKLMVSPADVLKKMEVYSHE